MQRTAHGAKVALTDQAGLVRSQEAIGLDARGRVILGGVLGLLLGLVWSTPAFAVSTEFFGLTGWAPPSSQDDWNQIGEGRVGTWRTALAWKDIEPNQPTQDAAPGCDDPVEDPGPVEDQPRWHCYTWSGFDSIVESAADAGMRVLPYAVASPSWATGCDRCPPLTDQARADWRRFLKRAVERYGENGMFWIGDPAPKPIKWVQAWNEPNFNTNWCHAAGNQDCRVSAREYGRFVKDTCNAVRGTEMSGTDCAQLDPSAPGTKVLLAGLPETYQSNDTRMIRFLRNVYENVPKVKRYFRGVALHAYATGREGVRGAVLRAKDAMKDYGGWNYLGTKIPIWVTEFGWATSGPPSDTCGGSSECRRAPDVAFKTDWAGQRHKLKRTYRMLANHTSDYHLARAIWFSYQDYYDEDKCCSAGTWAYYTGLFFRADFQPNPPWPKPAWCGYVEIANEFLPDPDPTPPDCTPPE